jgi:hypothetical protein
MEYHADRFQDFSFIVLDDKDNIISLFPANIKNNTLYSHQGLTFGGFLSNDKMKIETMLNIFSLLKSFLLENKIVKVVYKAIPYIYHQKPSQEDLYALFINNAQLTRRDTTTTICLENKIKYQEQRKRAIKRAIKNEIIFEESKDYKAYWNLLEQTLLSQYNSKPVHSLTEIEKLATCFPNNIKLFIAKKNDVLLAGTVLFENSQIVHTQYLANSQEGRSIGALDFVLDTLINKVYQDKKYFDFGTSNQNQGKDINFGLISQKEGFGARVVTHDFYEMEIG